MQMHFVLRSILKNTYIEEMTSCSLKIKPILNDYKTDDFYSLFDKLPYTAIF